MNRLLFELIRVALGRQECLSGLPSSDEWPILYQMAEEQAILGICFAGVQKQIRRSDIKLQDNGLYYQWLAAATQIQQRNEVLNTQSVIAYSNLQKVGYKSCILKGQGIANLYSPELAMLRQSGDIDLYVADGMKSALGWAKESYGNVAYDYVHAHLPMFKETDVELHWRVAAIANLIKRKVIRRNSLGM